MSGRKGKRYKPAPFTIVKGQCPNCGEHDRELVSHRCIGARCGTTHCGCFYDDDNGQEYTVANDCTCAQGRAAEEAENARSADESARAIALAQRVRELRGDALARAEAALAGLR